MAALNMPADEIRRLVTTRQAAEHYGFTPDQAGYICCPFHKEKTASLKLFSDGGFKCFGCGAGGSVIDFVMRLFDLSFPQAIVRIDSDFRLGLTGRRPDRREASRILEQRRREKEEREALEDQLRRVNAEHRYWWEVLKYFSPSLEDVEAGCVHPLYVKAVNRVPWLDDWADELMEQLYQMKKGVRT